MNIRYKEDPGAWRKSTLLTVLGLAVLSAVLRWRHVLTARRWSEALAVLAGIAVVTWFRPQWFRSYYRFSTWAGFWSSQWVARLLLVLLFVLIITPIGILMRILGKDSLDLKRSSQSTSYWRQAKQGGSLDRLF
jgi:hypothetical protein